MQPDSVRRSDAAGDMSADEVCALFPRGNQIEGSDSSGPDHGRLADYNKRREQEDQEAQR